MKSFVFISSLLTVSFAMANAPMSVPAPKRPLKICYISMNNEKEFHVTKGFVDRLQRITGKKWVEVQEYLEKGGSPEKSLDQMIEKNQLCDGLVISGHHTGSFGGNRAQGSLTVEFMERTSCSKNKAKWFENVQSLWLQGCRTLGAPGEMGEQNVNLAEFHANRVNAVRAEDGLEQTQLQLAQEFSDLLDAQTPYATRFMKSFPQARLYGWTRTAPGEKRGSERSLLFHVHNMAIHTGGPNIKSWISNPLAKDMSVEQAEIYLQALVKLLQPAKDASVVKASLQAWDDHGKPNKKIGTVGFDNDDLASMPPLFGNGDETLPKSRELECKLRVSETEKATVEAVNRILQDPRLIALTFYTLKDVIVKNGDGSSGYRSSIVREMRNSRNLMGFLQEKLKNLHSSLVRKLEYYGFLNLISPSDASVYANELRTKAEHELMKEQKESDYEQRDYKVKILEEAVKSKLLSMSDVRRMLNQTNSKIFAESLLRIISNGDLYLPDAKIEELILSLGQALPDKSSEILSTIKRTGYWSPKFNVFAVRAIEAQKNDKYGYQNGLEEVLASPFVSLTHKITAAELLISKTEKIAETDKEGYKSLAVKSNISIFTDNNFSQSLRDKAYNVYNENMETYLKAKNPAAFKYVLTSFYNDSYNHLEKWDFPEQKKVRFRQLLAAYYNEAKSLPQMDNYAISKLLGLIYKVGGNDQLINTELNTALQSKPLAEIMRNFLSQLPDDATPTFNVANAIKILLTDEQNWYAYYAINLLFKSNIEKSERLRIFDLVLKSTTTERQISLSLLIQIGTSEQLSEIDKKHLTQKVLKMHPNALNENLYFRLAIGFLNPYVGAVNSQTIMEALKNDPGNSALKIFFANVWILERPNLTALPVQLDAYLKSVDGDSLGSTLYFMNLKKTIKPEIVRDFYLKILSLNSFDAEELGELRESFRGQDADYSDFQYAAEILKKIDEQLTAIYN